jgi:hypothetical protein
MAAKWLAADNSGILRALELTRAFTIGGLTGLVM